MIVIHPPADFPHLRSLRSTGLEDPIPIHEPTMDILLKEVQRLFEQQLKIESLLTLSKKLQVELKERLQSSSQCMLPSHNYELPTGKEHGTYLALEVGGSTLRVTLVDLSRRNCSRQHLRIRRIVTSTIDNNVRDLRGVAFFDWIAEKVGEMLSEDRVACDYMRLKEPLPMGIAWSFPIESVDLHHLVLSRWLIHWSAKLQYEAGISSAWGRASIAPSTRVMTWAN